MFYSDVILTKRGPLARVWLAAHWERKLSKAQFLQTDIEKSVDAIMGQSTVPMALRLSGQLLLGVVRIYSRKAKYLLDDCNEALLKIKMAFRAGAVDLTSDQLTAPRHTITLQPTRTEFDLLMPNELLQAWNVNPYQQKAAPSGNAEPNASASADARARSRSRSTTPGPGRALSLRPAERAFAQGAYGGAFAENASDFGLDSYEYDDAALLDLGMDDDIEAAERARVLPRRSTGLPRERGISTGAGAGAGLGGANVSSGRGLGDDSLDVGVGRDAVPEAGMASLGSMMLGGLDGGAAGAGLGFDDAPLDMGFDFGGDDMPELDLGFGDAGNDAGLNSFGMPGDNSSDAPRPATPEPEDSFQAALANVTPRTAAKIREAAERRLQAQAANAAPKSRRQIVDRFTELADSAATQNPLLKWTEDRYLPRSRAELEILTIQKDPAAHFFPWFDASAKDSKSFFFGSAALAPELKELFTFDLTAVQRKRSVSPGPGDDGAGSPDSSRSAKRLRADLGEDGDLESEVGRRAAEPLRELSFGPFGSDAGGLDFGGGDGGDTFDFGGGADEPGLDSFMLNMDQPGPEGEEGAADGGLRRSLRKGGAAGGMEDNEDGNDRPAIGRLSALTRLSTPDLDESSSSAGAAELAPSPSNPLAAFAARPSDAQAALERDSAKSGLSRNTVRAVKVLQTQLRPVGENEVDVEAEAEEGQKETLSFEEVSSKANRRAAAGFFFELLVLATKDCVKVKQDESFGDIEVQGKQKLWTLNV
ncbi:sister chromatid cohesion protein 1 [Tilletia horrida]|nr:sister chromatid cohesion protein 1 [Tilletia horrida]